MHMLRTCESMACVRGINIGYIIKAGVEKFTRLPTNFFFSKIAVINDQFIYKVL